VLGDGEFQLLHDVVEGLAGGGAHDVIRVCLDRPRRIAGQRLR
jgi:hypothetical protein